MYWIDRIAHTCRWASTPAEEKLLLALGGLAVCLAAPPLTGGPAMFVLSSGLALAAARLPAAAYFAVLGVPLGFLAAGTPMLLLSVDLRGTPMLGLRPDQLPLALALAARAAGGAACLSLLVLTTPVQSTIPLLRRIGVPAFLVEIMLLTYRLIFVVAETALRGYQAQAARLGYAGRRQALRSLGLLGAGLFARAIGRARRMETGLAARGFEGDLPTLAEDHPRPRAGHLISIAVGLVLVLLLSFALEPLVHV